MATDAKGVPWDKARHFVDDEHALYVGWVIGSLVKQGMRVLPVCDEHGNYTAIIDVFLGAGAHVVTLHVPPPSQDWKENL
jgi:hypothetical protein